MSSLSDKDREGGSSRNPVGIVFIRVALVLGNLDLLEHLKVDIFPDAKVNTDPSLSKLEPHEFV